MENTHSKLDKKIIHLSERLMFKLALFSAAMMTVLGSVVISPALPAISKHFINTPHIETLTGLVLTIPALFVVFFSPLAGVLMDRFGKIRFLYPAMIVWIIAGVSGCFMDSIYTLLISRCIFGIATAFITTAASALLGDYYAVGVGRKDRALSLQGFVLAIGGAILTIIGGYLASFSWRYVFIVYSSGIAIFIFCLFYLFEPRVNKKKKANIPKEPMQYKPFLPIYFIGFFIMAIYYLAAIQFPHYIEELGLDSKYIGVAMATPTLSYGIFCYLYKDFAKVLNIKQIYIFGLILEALGFLLVFLFANFIIVLISLFLFGVAGGLLVTNNSAYLFSLAPAHKRARAYSVLASCIFFGQFISPFITTPMVHYFGLRNEFLIWVGVILLVSFVYARLKIKSA
ncbi:MFS transporter [Helicobacter sp. MIT 14-3879]|uniref:MFS transporter n=1 Tax=Helicobacter sp. MIT 14-3879 TaxID=2040649 RepID=UPI000E1E49AE|nr:MFS transporter [Helicobacter sp. MIT 14-3879]RDU60864.1 multidrug DMT transporter permease [Helicobacter sp. MIT 14-3879]